MSDLRIGVDARVLIREAGGVTTYLRSVLESIPADCPHEIVLLDDATDASAETAIHQRFPTVHSPVAGSSREVGGNLMAPAWLHLRLPKLLREERIDVAWGPSGYIPRCTRVPRVVTIHDLAPLHDPSGRRSLWGAYFTWETRHAMRCAARILADSEFTLDDLASHFPSAARRAEVIHLAASRKRRAEPSFPDAWQKMVPDDASALLCVGAYQERRNAGVVIDALAQLPDELRSRTRLVLCGADDPPAVDVLGRARERGVPEQVASLGRVTDEELEGLYRRADVVVVPSRFEGFGLPALEAMTRGVPVIAADATSLPEVVGDAGIVLSPDAPADWAREIERLLTNRSARDDLSRRGLAHAGTFSWERTAEATLVALEQAARDGH